MVLWFTPPLTSCSCSLHHPLPPAPVVYTTPLPPAPVVYTTPLPPAPVVNTTPLPPAPVVYTTLPLSPRPQGGPRGGPQGGPRGGPRGAGGLPGHGLPAVGSGSGQRGRGVLPAASLVVLHHQRRRSPDGAESEGHTGRPAGGEDGLASGPGA